MTGNMDEFDQDQFDASGPMGTHETQPASVKQSFLEAWRNKPILKLVIIMIGVGAALALVLGTVTPDRKPLESDVAKAPALNEAPGGAASPFFIEQNSQANDERAREALEVGGSAIPTPVGHDVSELIDKNKKDPLVEFREETERLKHEMRVEQQQNAQQLAALQQKLATQSMARSIEADDSLARAMQKQMQELMESWVPRQAKFVSGYGKADEEEGESGGGERIQTYSQPQQEPASRVVQDRTIVPAGTVNYVQLLTEANSDIPGPILVQILSGPLSGGRAIGRFQVMNDYLVMTFNLVSYKGREYAVDALALDPDTTLGGMATEVDHRYFSRVLLPAAGAFVSAFGQALSETDTTTTVSDGSVLQDKAKKGTKEALYSGLGQAGQTMSQFFQNEANNIKTLVRVAVGTPMGLFFLKPVVSSGRSTGSSQSTSVTDSSTKGSVPYPQKSSMGNAMQGLPPAQAQMLENMMSMMGGAAGTGR